MKLWSMGGKMVTSFILALCLLIVLVQEGYSQQTVLYRDAEIEFYNLVILSTEVRVANGEARDPFRHSCFFRKA